MEQYPDLSKKCFKILEHLFKEILTFLLDTIDPQLPQVLNSLLEKIMIKIQM